jgi:hypothetical protein
MNRTACLIAAAALVCTVLIVGLFIPAKSSARGNQSEFALSLGPGGAKHWDSTVMPEWLHWAFSNAGRHALHFSSHAAAPGLLKLVGDEPTVMIVPALSPDTLIDAPPPATVAPCNANGVQFNKEPTSGDPSAPVQGVIQPLDKTARDIGFILGGGQNGGDLIIGSATDQRGLFKGLGGSVSLTVFHTKDLTAGTPDCTPNFEAGLPDVVDSKNVTVSGFADPRVVADGPNGQLIVADIHTGTASDGNLQNDFFVAHTNLVFIQACASAKEGKAKNKACWPNAYTVLDSEVNRTAGTGFFINHVSLGLDSAGIITASALVTSMANNTSLMTAQCPESATSAAQCSPFTTVATGTASNPITTFSSAVAPNRNLLFAYSQGNPTAQFPSAAINSVVCTPHTPPNAPTCASPVLVTDDVPVVTVPGQQFIVDNSPPVIAAGGSNIGVVHSGCHGSFTPFTTPSKVNECAQPQIGISISTDGGLSYTVYPSLPAMAGRQYYGGLVADAAGNLKVTFLNTGTDTTGQSFKVTLAEIPAALTAPTVSTITPKPIDPSAGFSSAGIDWSGPAMTHVSNGTSYVAFTTTNTTGNWGSNTKLGKQTNAIVRIGVAQ